MKLALGHFGNALSSLDSLLDLVFYLFHEL
jgi:hypothetical protein